MCSQEVKNSKGKAGLLKSTSVHVPRQADGLPPAAGSSWSAHKQVSLTDGSTHTNKAGKWRPRFIYKAYVLEIKLFWRGDWHQPRCPPSSVWRESLSRGCEEAAGRSQARRRFHSNPTG